MIYTDSNLKSRMHTPVLTRNASLVSIQVLRAVAALLVVSCHIGSIGALYTGVRVMPDWGKCGVDLFFVISGFVMTYISHTNLGKPAAAGPFLLKRVLRIYPVYWEFTLVVLLVIVLHPDVINSGAAEHASIIKSLLLWPQMIDPVLGVGWSLIYEMYFYILFCAAFLLPRKFAPYLLAAWFLLLLYVRLAGLNLPPSGEVWVITSPVSFEFMMGCALAWLFRRGVKVNALPLFTAAFIWWLIAISLVNTEISPLLQMIAWCVPSALLLYGALMVEMGGGYQFPRWLIVIGDASYSLYLSHSLVISAFGKLWAHFHLNGILAQLLFIVSCFAVSLALALLNYRFVERPLSRWYHGKV